VRVYPIIKCTNIACNLKCEYCFYRYLDQIVKPDSIMSQEMLGRLTEQLLEINPQKCDFLWHGGEPLLAGIDFFKRAVELQNQAREKNGVQIRNSIQTNGVLLNREWARFFKKNGFSVGVSIDGPEHMQNRYRVKANKKGSFKATLRGIHTCQAEDISVGAIAVITSYNAQFPEEVYRFFVNNGLKKFSLNPVFETDFDGRPCHYSVSDDAFAAFLEKVLDLWLADDDPEIEIRQFTQPLTGMVGGQITSCVFSGRCHIFLDIHPNGDVRPCHSFKGEAEVLGNVLTQDLLEIIRGDKYKKFSASTLKLPVDCLCCEWLSICHGGCTDHRNVVVDGKLHEKYVYCGSRKRTFRILDQVVRLSSG